MKNRNTHIHVSSNVAKSYTKKGLEIWSLCFGPQESYGNTDNENVTMPLMH